MRLVLIEWLDSHAGRGWQDFENIEQATEPLYCRSVGWLAADTDESKVIVAHLAGEKRGRVSIQGSGDLTIPTGSIVKMRNLR